MFALHVDNEGDEAVCRIVEVADDGETVLRVVEEKWRKPREEFEREHQAALDEWEMMRQVEEVFGPHNIWEYYFPASRANGEATQE